MMNQESNKHVRWKVCTKNAGMHNRIKNIIHQLFIVFHQIGFLKVIKKQLVFTEFFFFWFTFQSFLLNVLVFLYYFMYILQARIRNSIKMANELNCKILLSSRKCAGGEAHTRRMNLIKLSNFSLGLNDGSRSNSKKPFPKTPLSWSCHIKFFNIDFSEYRA